MTEQQQVNTKVLPPHPGPDDLYNYLYNRKERRSHTPEKRKEIKGKLWANFLKNIKELEAKKEEAANGREDTTIPEETSGTTTE